MTRASGSTWRLSSARKFGLRTPPGYWFHSISTALGTRPTQSHSARVRTSTILAPGELQQSQASRGVSSPW
jgi:hypothetical protein